MPTQKSKRQSKWLAFLFGTLDIVVTLSTLFFAVLLTNKFTNETVLFNEELALVSLFVLVIWIILLKSTHLARIPRTSVIPIILSDFIRLSLIGGFILLVLDYLIRLDNFPAITLLIFVVANFFSLFFFRMFSFRFFKMFRASGHNIKNIILFADEQSVGAINKLLNQKEWGYNIKHIISDSHIIKAKFGNTVNIHPLSTDIIGLLKNDIIDELLLFNNPLPNDLFNALIEISHELGITVRVQGDQNLPPKNKTRIQYFHKIPFVTIVNSPISTVSYAIKAVSEISVAFVLLIALSPVLLVLSLSIAVTSRGPIVYKQVRVGLRGRRFHMYKFRTTYCRNCKTRHKQINGEPQLTHVGKFISRFKLDFIPQFLNVIKGEMTLVGPKAPTPEEVASFKPSQLKLLSVKPGLTCSWQIDPNRTLNKGENGVEMDLLYIENWSIKSDIELFFKTFRFVFNHNHIKRSA